MINDGINNIPEKTIGIFKKENISYENVLNILKKPTAKRDWFTPHFYKCLPLIIGNQHGFTISFEYDIDITWNGEDGLDSIVINKDIPDSSKNVYPNISSIFGSGIVTVVVPFVLRTPPGINIMTVNPPNYILPNITVMTGVVETDNLRQMFTFNLKMQIPGITTKIPKNYPVAGFIPIPRYFADSFVLKDAESIFSNEIYQEELIASQEHDSLRNYNNNMLSNKKIDKYVPDRLYMKGKDVYGNLFKDHQGPGGNSI